MANKESSFRWQDIMLLAGFGLTTAVALKVFLGNNGNGHARNGGSKMMLPPHGYSPYDMPPPGMMGMPPGAIPYNGPSTQTQKQLPPGYSQYPPLSPSPTTQPPRQQTPGVQNTIGRQVMPSSADYDYPDDGPQPNTVHTRRGVRVAGSLD